MWLLPKEIDILVFCLFVLAFQWEKKIHLDENKEEAALCGASFFKYRNVKTVQEIEWVVVLRCSRSKNVLLVHHWVSWYWLQLWGLACAVIEVKTSVPKPGRADHVLRPSCKWNNQWDLLMTNSNSCILQCSFSFLRKLLVACRSGRKGTSY